MKTKDELWLIKLKKQGIEVNKNLYWYKVKIKENFNSWQLLDETLVELQKTIIDSDYFKSNFKDYRIPMGDYDKNKTPEQNLENYYEYFLLNVIKKQLITLDLRKLKADTIPANVVNARCDFVNKIQFGQNLKLIKENSFNNLYNVFGITFPQNIKLEKNVFLNIGNSGLHIPKNSPLSHPKKDNIYGTLALIKFNLIKKVYDQEGSIFELKIKTKENDILMGDFIHFEQLKLNKLNYNNLRKLYRVDFRAILENTDNEHDI
jgi:hypothetical protein